jgi:sugar O-acyltransferase (sialic acid O-acetyltransferase NeuD family)
MQSNGLQPEAMTTADKLVVVGAGGHGSEVQAYIRDLAAQGWKGEFLGFVDDHAPIGRHRNVNVLGTLAELCVRPPEFLRNLVYFTALGDNPSRLRLVERIESLAPGLRPWTLIHPLAYVGEDVEIGAGTLLAPGTIVTSRVKIGRHCILNVKASVSHDCVVGDYANINPGVTVCGNCRIGEGAYIGTGATVINGATIGAGAIIGGGAMVVRDIPPHVTAVGVPARIIKQL